MSYTVKKLNLATRPFREEIGKHFAIFLTHSNQAPKTKQLR